MSGDPVILRSGDPVILRSEATKNLTFAFLREQCYYCADEVRMIH